MKTKWDYQTALDPWPYPVWQSWEFSSSNYCPVGGFQKHGDLVQFGRGLINN